MLTAHHTNPCGGRRKSLLKFEANPPTAVFDRLPNPDLLTTSEQNPHFTLSMTGDRLLGLFNSLNYHCIWTVAHEHGCQEREAGIPGPPDVRLHTLNS